MKLIVVTSTLILFLMLAGCADKYPVVSEKNPTQAASSSCVECHSDAELLQTVAIPLPPDTSGGSGES